MRKILFFSGVILTAVLTWFAVSNYQGARPIAEENLRGLALSLSAAIENIAIHDPSLQNLSSFQAHEIAFFALIDQKGLYRFHSNPDLIGKKFQGDIPPATLQNGTISSERTELRTGENAFEFNAPFYLGGETLVLRLTLHTYRADTVIRQARLNMMVLFGLLTAGWILALTLYRFTRREEQHNLEMERRESLAKLGEMGALLAHEIRNPLSGIKGFAQVIEKKPQDERNSGFARSIVMEALRLESLVTDLLDYAGSNLELMESVDICSVISHMTDFLRHDAEQSQINIISKCPESVLITGNKNRLSQALLNLGRNAIQAISEGGSLTVMATVGDKFVTISIIDTGSGIKQENLTRIFDPFFTTKAKGTGLGLALCKKVVEEHCGGIDVKSIAGQGTTVSITIPNSWKHRNRS